VQFPQIRCARDLNFGDEGHLTCPVCQCLV
jgi:hypothetical protein